MEYKKIPWWDPRIGSPLERTLVEKVFSDNYANEGDLATQFETEVAKLLNVRYAVVTTSGTVALFLALKASGIGAGDEVIVPDATFIATANAVSLCGATPILVDIDPTTLNISIEAIENAITKKTKAIVPVHVTGRPADMERIIEIAKQHNLKVIEDAAEAFASKHNGKYLGTWGDAGCFSFSAAKTITTGQGGMIVTNDQNLYEKLKPLKDQGRPVRGTGGNDLHDTIGYNFKFTNIQSALGLGQLALLNERTERLRRNYTLYKQGLKDVPEVSIFEIDIQGGAVPQWTDAIVECRDELEAYLRTCNMDCRPFWLPIHKQKSYPLLDDTFPHATKLLPQALWFPSAFTLTDEDVLCVVAKIKEFYSHTK